MEEITKFAFIGLAAATAGPPPPPTGVHPGPNQHCGGPWREATKRRSSRSPSQIKEENGKVSNEGFMNYPSAASDVWTEGYVPEQKHFVWANKLNVESDHTANAADQRVTKASEVPFGTLCECCK